VPVLQGRTPADWRTCFYYQYYEYPKPHHVRPHYGIVTDRYKLVQFYGTGEDYTELFDLRKDPSELHDVLNDPAYASVRADLTKELARQRREVKAPETVPEKWFGNEPVRPTARKP
jgi:arylsulfatase A-like enzyme